MDLKDLANEERGMKVAPVPAAAPPSPVPAAKDSWPAGPPGVR